MPVWSVQLQCPVMLLRASCRREQQACLCEPGRPGSAASSGHTSSAGSRCGQAAHSWGAGSEAVAGCLPGVTYPARGRSQGHEWTWGSCLGDLPLQVSSPVANQYLLQKLVGIAPGKPAGHGPCY